MDWIMGHWQQVLVGFMILEKVVKLSPAKWDDILVDGIKSVAVAIKTKKTIQTL